MKIDLPYGKTHITAEVPFSQVTILSPHFTEGLIDEKSAFTEAVRLPVNARPMRDIVSGSDTLAVLVPDITRPFPSQRILPWLFAEFSHVPVDNITIVIGNGSHRANTRDELSGMLGADVCARYRVVNHNAHDFNTMLPAGKRDDGGIVYMNREYVSADKRIIMGFIEPHFMAGFSGGYKAVMPGVADIDSITYYHRPVVIAHKRSAWGILDGNPTQEQIRKYGALVKVDFCINVTINSQRRITGFFCGDPLVAHSRGCEFARKSAMAPCAGRFPVVITTNGGYPLDQNLYQSVKGISAAAQIVEQDGLIIAVSECADGFPSHGNFARLLFDHESPKALLDTVMKPGFSMFDQWEAQLLAMIRMRASVAIFSALPAEDVRRAHMDYIGNLDEYLAALMRRLGENAPIAVMPEGPLTIPYIQR